MEKDISHKDLPRGPVLVVAVAMGIVLVLLALGHVFGASEKTKKGEDAPAATFLTSCAPAPCRDEAMSVIDTDGQRIECSSERHVLTFQLVEGRTFAFCRCGTPAAGGALVAPPLGSAGKP